MPIKRPTRIYVNPDIAQRLKEMAGDKSIDAVLLELIEFYNKYKDSIGRETRPRELDPAMVDRVAWYIEKLAFTVQSLKDCIDFPLDAEKRDACLAQQSARAREVAHQVYARLGVDTKELEQAINEFAETPSTESKVELNEALKHVIIELMKKALA